VERLIYHQATLDLLGIAPAVSPDRVATVRAREQACGYRFPASVAEWYSLEGAEDLFHEHTGGEWLTPLEELGGDVDQLRLGFLCVADENQGAVVWYARLDAGDDPLVLGDARAMTNLRGVTWVTTASQFSTFVYRLVAEYRAGG
jgi:hypothetical protein